MPNVNSWTESEIDVLVQAWSEVEAKHPLQLSTRNARMLHAKLYALFSKRCKFTRTSNAVNRAKFQLRSFALFVKRFDEDRRKDGGRLWFELSVDEREQRRKMLPPNARGVTSSVSRKAFATLLTMQRAQRWMENAPTDSERHEDAQDTEVSTSFLSSLPPSPHPAPPAAVPKDQDADEDEFSSLFESTSPSTGLHDEELEEGEIPDSSSSSPMSAFDADESSNDTSGESWKSTVENGKTDQGPQRTLKHRECKILLDNMVKLQNNKMRRAVNKLRADIEGEIQRSSEMLRSISSNQHGEEEEEEIQDAPFVSKVLDMQLQQVQDRFDQFDEKQNIEEAANRALLSKGFQ